MYPDSLDTGSEQHTNGEPETPHDSPVVLAHVIAEAVRDLAAGMPQHEHAWDILDVQAPPEPAVRMPMVSPLAATYVLVRCVSCGLPDTLTLAGMWTLARLRADAFAEERREWEREAKQDQYTAIMQELGAMPVAEITALLAPYRTVPAE